MSVVLYLTALLQAQRTDRNSSRQLLITLLRASHFSLKFAAMSVAATTSFALTIVSAPAYAQSSSDRSWPLR